jgi:hypothetical protein
VGWLIAGELQVVARKPHCNSATPHEAVTSHLIVHAGRRMIASKMCAADQALQGSECYRLLQCAQHVLLFCNV